MATAVLLPHHKHHHPASTESTRGHAMVQKRARKQGVSFTSTHLLVSAHLFRSSSFSPHPPKTRGCSPPQPCTKHDAQGLLLPQRSEEPRSWHRRAWLSPAPGSSAGRWKSCLLSSHLWRENGHIIHPNEHLTAKKDLIQVSVYVHTIKLHLELELSQPCVEHLSSPGQSKRPQA